jgi:ABC-2 type transport system ATP-binding protein
MISARNISKSYKIPHRPKGLGSAFFSLIKRRYKTVEALKNISFEIEKGEIVGYIGPNGAGKSTTIKILSGILHPDSGECIVNGKVPYKERESHVANIGVVFGQRSQLWWDIPVIDSFDLIKDIYSVDDKLYKENLELMTQTLDLKEFLNTPVRQLSLGMRMRCELAASLLHSPDILFLDEPTIGLDAVSKLAVRKFIKTVNRERQVTVILTTHDMNDIEALSDRVILIGKGQLLYDGDFNSLKNDFSPYRKVTVQFNSANNEHLPDSFSLETIENGRAIYKVDSKISVNDTLLALSKRYQIQDFSINDEAVENVVARVYEEYSL